MEALSFGSSVVQFARSLLIFLMLCFPAGIASAHPALIPQPSAVDWHNGNVPIGPHTRVEGSGQAAETASYLARELGLKPDGRGASRIRLSLVPASRIANPEGYHLLAAGNELLIEASDPRGLFYGAQTLRQLVKESSGVRYIPGVEISDDPRFRWRGLLIDLGRHFFGKQTLFKFIDEMAAYKLNVLHLHLTDDPGWRLEIRGYPKLTQAAVASDGTRQYFNADEIREIVAYAAERHIIVVPEIEMPSHAGSVASAYPELYKGGSALDPANPQTYAFIRAVFTQVAQLFPEPYLHFGGDEVADDAWKGLKDVDELKAKSGLKTTKEVEAYFVRNVVGIIQSLGKRPMAWDEQAEAGASKDVVIEWWRKGRYMEFMTFPRLLAFAEVAWRQKGPRDDNEFDERLAPHVEALRARGINARRDETDGYEFITH